MKLPGWVVQERQADWFRLAWELGVASTARPALTCSASRSSTARANAAPSSGSVPLPTSSSSTSERGPATARIYRYSKEEAQDAKQAKQGAQPLR